MYVYAYIYINMDTYLYTLCIYIYINIRILRLRVRLSCGLTVPSWDAVEQERCWVACETSAAPMKRGILL